MKANTKEILFEAWLYCDEEDKSTEFMLQYMSDQSGLAYDEVVDFVTKTKTEDRVQWIKNRNKND